MSFGRPDWAQDEAKKAMLVGLQTHVRGKIRAVINDAVQQEVEAAVDAAMQGFKAHIDAYMVHGEMDPRLRVIVDYQFNKKEAK